MYRRLQQPAERSSLKRRKERGRDFIAHKKRERWGGGLSAQAAAFAGANAEEKESACFFRNDGCVGGVEAS